MLVKNFDLRTYKKKADILKELGKSSDDTRYLDRAIERGDVIVVRIDGLERYIVYEEAVIFFLGAVIRRGDSLVGAIDSLGADNVEVDGLKDELEEAKINVAYYEKENEELNDRNIALKSIIDKLKEGGANIDFGREFE